MIYGETINSVDDLNRLTGLKFRFVPMKIDVEYGGDRYLSGIWNVPKTIGVYVHFYNINGKYTAVYAGKCESYTRGIHKRIQNEFYYSNNEKLGKESGPLAVFNRLKRHDIAFEWGVAYAMVDYPAYEEAKILDKINFIGNSTNNCGLRLYVLDSVVAKLKIIESAPPAPVIQTSNNVEEETKSFVENVNILSK